MLEALLAGQTDVSVLAEERQRLLLAPVGIVEVLRPALRLVDGQHFHARVDALGPVLEAFDVVNDGRNRLQAGDDPERVRLGQRPGEHARQVARLVLFEEQTEQVGWRRGVGEVGEVHHDELDAGVGLGRLDRCVS